MRWILLLAVGAALAGAFWFLLRGAERGAEEQDPLALRGPVDLERPAERAPVRRPAGSAAIADPTPGRDAPPTDAAFEEEMRSRYAAQSVAALAQASVRLRQQVAIEAMKVGQPLVEDLGVDLADVSDLAPDVLVFRGADAERRMRGVVLAREDYPQLTYKHREAVWLQHEISRRQQR